MLLEFQWGPSRGLQEVHHEKRRALLQRSSRRVEEIKAKATRAKIQPEVQAPSEAGEQSKAQESQPVTCKEKLKTEPQHKTNTKSKGGQAELHQTTEKSGFIKPKKPQLPPPGILTFYTIGHFESSHFKYHEPYISIRPTSWSCLLYLLVSW